jgi:SAM-dependent methyltransferase
MKNLLKKIIPLRQRIKLRYLQIKLMYFFKKGDKYNCPICNSSYLEFAAFNGRENRMCPNCFSLERHRLLYFYLKNETKIFSEKYNVLHFAPEKCLNQVLSKNLNLTYQTADLMTEFIDMIEVKPKYVMSVTDIKFEDNTFDFIICNHVLEHVPDDKKAISELFRVLKPNGIAILQVPINFSKADTLEELKLNSEQRNQLYGSPDHLRFYGYEDYPRRLNDTGFRVDLSNYVLSQNIERNILDKNEVLYICRK